MSHLPCPICNEAKYVRRLRLKEVVDFQECVNCDYFFFVPPFEKPDEVHKLVSHYSERYWTKELSSARDRAFGISLARASEVFLLSRIPISNFVDIGTGPGYFLDAIDYYLPKSEVKFSGIEKYPPPAEYQTKSTGYRIGWLDLYKANPIDSGICIEVLEHLTSSEVYNLFLDLFQVSAYGALFLFNTALTDYVTKYDPGYLDPLVRGHISVWSITSIKKICEPIGWSVREIPNRNWSFVVEKREKSSEDLISRIWDPNQKNLQTLRGSLNSDVLFLLGRDGLRAN
jgi:hypothetical protein